MPMKIFFKWLYVYFLTPITISSYMNTQPVIFYFAHNAFTNEGTYVPDVYDIDAERNRIFINATDFTGYKPGDFLPGDMTDAAVTDWDTFLSENFVKLTEENEAEIKAFDWLQLPEQE